jgi:predicted permease
VPIRDELVGDVRAPVLLLQIGVLLVLLIACANVANLLLMRATGRHREVAIRAAIGAGRGHVIRQLLVEGFVLSSIGAGAGLAVGLAGVAALVALAGDQLPGALDASLNWPLVGAAAALAAVTGLVFGLIPAASALRTSVMGVLRDDSARGSASRRTGVARAVLVVAEVALAVMLLVGAGLLIKSFARLQHVNPGFSADNVLTAQISLPSTRYVDDAARREFWARLVERARAIPGVTSAGLTSNIPLSGRVSSGSYSIVGYTPGPNEAAPHARQEVAGGDYFRSMQIPLMRGRVFDDRDAADSPRVVVVDQYLVDRYFRGKDPIGAQIRRGDSNSAPFTIVGVVGTINAIDLGQPVTKERIYYPVAQQPRPGLAILLKTTGDPQELVAPLRAAVRSLDPEQPVSGVRTMDQWVSRSLQTRRAPALLLSIFGAVALLLAAIGIYGVLAFGVAQRVREMGIRQALGADRRAIMSLVLGHGIRMAGAGVALGLAGAFALSRYLESQLFGVGARDLSVFAGAPALLLVVAIAACYVPARRSTRIDPMAALRDG